ncbi:ABC transporter permease [Photobacterium kagoshimensis]|uniref:ABC transporter permease n=1 Tax=Photobacterium kagoshimensis TaxID=2910242 RepID=UPI003D0F9E1D
MIHILFLSAILLCILPLIPGMAGILLPAFSWLPSVATQQIPRLSTVNLDGFHQALLWPGVSQSILLSLFTGVTSSIIALTLTFLILQANWHKPRWQKIERMLSPMLAMPHVAFAIGFAFLFSPTGWIYRAIESLGFSSHDAPSLIQDPYGFGLITALTIKETPFLVLMSVSILKQLHVDRLYASASGLGYNRADVWLKVILPQWLPKMRLPFYAVLAFGLSVVDVALIIGPTRPPTFSVLVWQWFNEPDISLLPRAAAGTLCLLLIAFMALATARLFEWLILSYWRNWQTQGAKPRQLWGATSYVPLGILPLCIIPILIIWSFAQRWRFPDIFPSRLNTRFWQQELPSLWELTSTSLVLALISTGIALVLTIGCLEYRDKYQRSIPFWLIAIPMVIPQLSLLFGLQVATHFIAGQHYWLWVCWSHVLFVFPYLYLALDGPWRSFDARLYQSARSLGLTHWQAWWKVKRVLLQPSIWIAVAIGLSVSLTQYLPTQMLGAGRVSTITTEAVALASGQDRRVSAIYGILQGLLPFIFFSLALFASNHSGIRPRVNKQRSTSTDEFICGKPNYK